MPPSKRPVDPTPGSVGDQAAAWQPPGCPPAVLAWLLAPDDPPLRLFTLRHLLDRPPTDPEVRGAQAAVGTYRPLQAILDQLAAPSYWERSGDEHLRQHTVWLYLLAELGVEPAHPPVRRACELAWQTLLREDGAFPSRHPVYPGMRPCSQGLLGRALVQLSPGPDPRLERAVDFAAAMAYECSYNGGLPCAWGAVKLLRLAAAVPPGRRSAALTAATQRGVEFLLSYDLARADYPSPDPVSPEWFRFGFPRGYESDVLETLETLAQLGGVPAGRVQAAVELVLSKQGPDGRWLCESVGPQAQEVGIDRVGEPSKWVTLRALRVLKAWSALSGQAGETHQGEIE